MVLKSLKDGLNDYCITYYVLKLSLQPQQRSERSSEVYYLKSWTVLHLVCSYTVRLLILHSGVVSCLWRSRAGHRLPLIDSESFSGKLRLWPSDTGTRTTTESLTGEPSIKLPLRPRPVPSPRVFLRDTMCLEVEHRWGGWVRSCLDHRLTARPGPPASVSERGESDNLHLQIYPPRPRSPHTIPTSSPTSRKTSF